MSKTDDWMDKWINDDDRQIKILRATIVMGVVKLAVEVAGILLLVAFIIWAFSPR